MPLVKLRIFRDDRREMNGCSEWVKTHDAINLTGWTGMNIIYYIYIYYVYIYIYNIYIYIHTCSIWPIYQLRIGMTSCTISWEFTHSGWTDPVRHWTRIPGFVRRHMWSCQKVAVRRSIAATKALAVFTASPEVTSQRRDVPMTAGASWGFISPAKMIKQCDLTTRNGDLIGFNHQI